LFFILFAEVPHMRTVSGLLALLMLVTCFALAQEGPSSTLGRSADLRGRVYVGKSTPAPFGAMVQLEATESGMAGNTQTDSQGTFHFLALTRSQYILHIRLPGYEPYQESFDLTVNTHAYAVIYLKPLPGRNAESGSIKADTVSVRDANIPDAAAKEFEKGKQLLVEKKDFAGSISHLRKATKLYNNFPQAYVLLGVALMSQKNVKEADEALNTAIRLDDKMGDAYVALGMLQNSEKKFAESQRTITRALELKPESFEAEYELGKSYWATGNLAEAEAHGRKALRLRPDFGMAHILLGNVALRKDDSQSALAEFREYIKLDPKSPLADAVRDQIAKIEKSTGSK
jgi:tetratricopeptide (TPR) repeat protein